MHQLNDKTGMKIEGHVKIVDPDSGEVIVNKRNAINYENMSVALANLLAGLLDASGNSYNILEMAFGNGGVNVDSSGTLIYKATNTSSATGTLYNETYQKGVSNTVSADAENNVQVSHVGGNNYSDVIITCTLGYSEPSGQDTIDNATDLIGDYVFDELGLRTQSSAGASGDESLITHIIFHPVQKSANRKIQVIYTIRITAGS